MSARLRLAPALLVTLLGVALALHMSPSGAGSTVNPAHEPRERRGWRGDPVADMDRSVAFYSTVLFFDTVSTSRRPGRRSTGCSGDRRPGSSRPHRSWLRLHRSRHRVSRPKRAPCSRRRAEQRSLVPAHRARRQRHGPGIPLASAPSRRTNLAGAPAAPGLESEHRRHPRVLLQGPGRPRARDSPVSRREGRRPLAAAERSRLPRDRSHGVVVSDTEKSKHRDTLGLRIAGGEAQAEQEREQRAGRPAQDHDARAAEGPASSSSNIWRRAMGGRTRGHDGPGSRPVAHAPGHNRRRRGRDQAGRGLRNVDRSAIISISDAAPSFRRGIALYDPDGHALQLRAR